MAHDGWSITHVPPGGGESLWIGGERVTLKAVSEDTLGGFACFELATPPAEATSPRIHHRADAAYYVLEGELEIRDLDHGATDHVGPGSFVFVPRGILHGFANLGAAPVRVLAILTPGGVERFFREVGEPAGAGGPAPAAPAAERLAAAARRHHVEVLPPGA